MRKPAEASDLTHGLVMAFVCGVAGCAAAYQGGGNLLDGLLICSGVAVVGFILGYLRLYF